MNSLGEKKEKQEAFGFQRLGPNAQHLILEHVQKQYEGVLIDKLPVEELRRLRYEVFRGKSFSDAIFVDPKEALKHIRGALSQEIDLRTPNTREVASHMGGLIRGMDPGDVASNLELLRNPRGQK
jgi:hypothetical protein